RNPWRWSFDRQNHDMWIGDVGQGTTEEVDHIPAGQKGWNFGWSDKEANDCFNEDPCDAPLTTEPSATFSDPVASYPHAGDAAVIGGYVYRGACFPDLQGTYFYADAYTDQIWTLDAGAASPSPVELDYTPSVDFITSFGEDADGELYVVTLGGSLYRVTA